MFQDFTHAPETCARKISNMRSDETKGRNFSHGDVPMGDTVIDGNTFYFLKHLPLFDPPLHSGIRRVRREFHLVIPPDFAENRLFCELFLMRYCLQEHCDGNGLDVPYLRQAFGQVSF